MARSDNVVVRVAKEEREALAAAAKREDAPMSHIIRRAIRRELERLAVEAKKGKKP